VVFEKRGNVGNDDSSPWLRRGGRDLKKMGAKHRLKERTGAKRKRDSAQH
jgi:hypothetical protein